jgi:hypothetical protein
MKKHFGRSLKAPVEGEESYGRFIIFAAVDSFFGGHHLDRHPLLF